MFAGNKTKIINLRDIQAKGEFKNFPHFLCRDFVLTGSLKIRIFQAVSTIGR
jgi:hypothetical protein